MRTDEIELDAMRFLEKKEHDSSLAFNQRAQRGGKAQQKKRKVQTKLRRGSSLLDLGSEDDIVEETLLFQYWQRKVSSFLTSAKNKMKSVFGHKEEEVVEFVQKPLDFAMDF